MTTLAIVDSLQAVARARKLGVDSIATDNPLLADDPRADDGVINMDALIDQREAGRLGALALELTADLDRRLTAPEIAHALDLAQGGMSITGPVSRLLASLLHRGAALAHALAGLNPSRIELLLVDAPRWEPGQPFMSARFTNPARALAANGFLAPAATRYEAVEAVLPATINETAARGLARRAAMLPAGLLAFEVANRLGLVWGPRGCVVIGDENEALREALPWLVLAGVRPLRRGKLTRLVPGPEVGFDREPEVDPLVDRALGSVIREGFVAAGVFSPQQTEAAAVVILQHLSAGLHHLSRQTAELRRRLDTWFGRTGGVLLTNGLFGPAGAQAHVLCRERGIEVVEFEHGVTAGIAALTDRKLALAGPPKTSMLLVCSERSRSAFVSARRTGGAPDVLAIGLPDQTRTLLRRPLQCFLARRSLGLGRRDRVIMHVSTRPYFGNHRPGLAAPTETTIWRTDRALIEEVYSRLPHRVVFKPYPTQRFPHEPAYAELCRPAANVMFTEDEDFRYLRAAADAIVTLTPTSTLGWAVGAGVPLIWLDSLLVNPLSDDGLRQRFRDSFLWVDIDRDDWQGRLRELLALDGDALEHRWQTGAKARAELMRDVIAGPEGSTGRRAAAAVRAFIAATRRNAGAAESPEIAS